MCFCGMQQMSYGQIVLVSSLFQHVFILWWSNILCFVVAENVTKRLHTEIIRWTRLIDFQSFRIIFDTCVNIYVSQ